MIWICRGDIYKLILQKFIVRWLPFSRTCFIQFTTIFCFARWIGINLIRLPWSSGYKKFWITKFIDIKWILEFWFLIYIVCIKWTPHIHRVAYFRLSWVPFCLCNIRNSYFRSFVICEIIRLQLRRTISFLNKNRIILIHFIIGKI